MRLKYGPVEAIVSEYVRADPLLTKRLRARIQQLQRLGLPAGANVGKGGRAIYGPEQLLQLIIALDFLDGGFSPDRSRAVVIGHWPMIKRCLSIAIDHSQNYFIGAQPNALDSLRQRLETDGNHVRLEEGSIEQLGILFESERSNFQALNLTGVLTELQRGIDLIVPDDLQAFKDEVRSWKAGGV